MRPNTAYHQCLICSLLHKTEAKLRDHFFTSSDPTHQQLALSFSSPSCRFCCQTYNAPKRLHGHEAQCPKRPKIWQRRQEMLSRVVPRVSPPRQSINRHYPNASQNAPLRQGFSVHSTAFESTPPQNQPLRQGLLTHSTALESPNHFLQETSLFDTDGVDNTRSAALEANNPEQALNQLAPLEGSMQQRDLPDLTDFRPHDTVRQEIPRHPILEPLFSIADPSSNVDWSSFTTQPPANFDPTTEEAILGAEVTERYASVAPGTGFAEYEQGGVGMLHPHSIAAQPLESRDINSANDSPLTRLPTQEAQTVTERYASVAPGTGFAEYEQGGVGMLHPHSIAAQPLESRDINANDSPLTRLPTQEAQTVDSRVSAITPSRPVTALGGYGFNTKTLLDLYEPSPNVRFQIANLLTNILQDSGTIAHGTQIYGLQGVLHLTVQGHRNKTITL